MITLEILAGKMAFDGKKVSPDQRKGILRLLIDSDADSIKLQWLDRSGETPVVENEWTSPVTIELVPSVKTGKVYVLKPASEEKCFIWIQQQSGNAAGDAAGYTAGGVDNVEALINQIQMFAQMSSGREATEMYSQVFGADEVGEDQMLVDLGHHDHHEGDDEEGEEELEELMEQLMAGSGGGEELPEQVLTLMLMNPEIQQALMAYLMQLACVYLQMHPELLGGAAPASAAEPPALVTVPVSAVVQSDESLASLTADEAIRTRLLALCPEGETDLLEVLRCPQLGEAMRSLTEGIYSDQIAVLFTSLGLDMHSEGSQDPFEALCQALEKKFRK